MVFPRFLRIGEMALCVLETFELDQRGVASPPLPLLDDYQDLCLILTLLRLRRPTRDFLVLEIP